MTLIFKFCLFSIKENQTAVCLSQKHLIQDIVKHTHIRLIAVSGPLKLSVITACSYKRDAMKKQKMSNCVITDVYQSNSRCVRNNNKPADNNVFTGRPPVSAGPQHHWQQQQQQLLLLMQADNST